jgi:hypothetical protein
MSTVEARPLSEQEVKQVVTDWYQKLDVHAPVQELVPMLAEDGLEMRFPEATLRGEGEFKQWYATVTSKFFDEIHEMKQLEIRTAGDHADVKLVVNWQAHVWNPPDAKSRWIGFDAAQSWVVSRSATTGRPVIKTYVVDALTPMPGSASL